MGVLVHQLGVDSKGRGKGGRGRSTDHETLALGLLGEDVSKIGRERGALRAVGLNKVASHRTSPEGTNNAMLRRGSTSDEGGKEGVGVGDGRGGDLALGVLEEGEGGVLVQDSCCWILITHMFTFCFLFI